MDPLIDAVNLRKRYRERTALDGVTLSVEAGEIVGLLGPNGAGKSTTLSILSTLLSPDGGSVRIGGHALPAEARAARTVLGFVPQQTAVYPTLTARENLSFFGAMQGLARSERKAACERALSLVSLDQRADEPVASFSGGMRRRLNLACGILHRPRVLLLDEPTVGVDPQSRERIFDAVAELRDDGAAVLYSTHSMEEAQRLCGRVILLDAGRIVAAGTTGQLLQRIGLRPLLRLRMSRPVAEKNLPEALEVLTCSGADLEIRIPDAGALPSVLERLQRAGERVVELELHTPNLSDVFFHLTGRALRDEDVPAPDRDE